MLVTEVGQIKKMHFIVFGKSRQLYKLLNGKFKTIVLPTSTISEVYYNN